MALTYSMILTFPLTLPYLDKTSRAINVPVLPIPALKQNSFHIIPLKSKYFGNTIGTLSKYLLWYLCNTCNARGWDDETVWFCVGTVSGSRPSSGGPGFHGPASGCSETVRPSLTRWPWYCDINDFCLYKHTSIHNCTKYKMRSATKCF